MCLTLILLDIYLNHKMKEEKGDSVCWVYSITSEIQWHNVVSELSVVIANIGEFVLL